MAFEPLIYSKTWENSEDFPAYEPNEEQVRADLQLLHDEAKEAINRLVGALNDPSAAAQLPCAAQGMEATTVQEAIEEAEYTMELIAPYKSRITLPVVYDWEKIYDDPEARTAGLPASVLSDCAVAFCETVKGKGYQPGIYFNRNSGYYGLDLTRMTEYPFWFALPESSFPNFYYKVDIWQYSFTETVPGIDTPTDMNLYFREKSA